MEQKYQNNCNWRVSTVFVFGVLILLRIILSNRMPSYILSDMPHDDGWVVTHALYILRGEWLGPYDQFTLIKGPFSPLLMAFSAYIGVTFRGLNTALYCLACVVFIVAISPIIKNKWLQIFCFLVLLFNPITYALETGQRIYRNAIGQWEILLIVACLIAIFLRRNEYWKRLLIWALICGLTLGTFFQTREDGVWLYPLVLGMAFATVIAFLVEKGGPKKKIALFLLPVAMALLLNGVTTVANYVYYGAPIVNDRSGGNYAKVAGDLYAIKPSADDDRLYTSETYKDLYYTIYVSTMEKAFAASPTLNSASQSIRDAIRMWASWEIIKSGQVSTDHMLFALRDGVKAAGHYKSLSETEAFYGKVHEELQLAFKHGVLEKHGFPISPVIKRLQKYDLLKAILLMPKAMRDISNFSGVAAVAIPASGSIHGIKEFSLTAGGDYYSSAGLLVGSGWAFAEDDKTRLNAGVYNKTGELIAVLPLQGGDDVFEGFKSKYQNAKMSRFSFKLDGYDLNSGLILRFFDQNGGILGEVPANGSVTCGGRDGSIHYCVDSLKNESSPEKFYARFVERANDVISIYQRITPLIALIAFFSYFAATVQLIREVSKKQALKILPVWLILTGIASTFILFVFCMCLITVTTFNALPYIYTAPAYILLLIFCTLSTSWGVGSFLEFRKLKYK